MPMLLAVVAFTFHLKPPMLGGGGGGCFSGYPNSSPSMHVVLGYVPHVSTTKAAIPNFLSSWLSARMSLLLPQCPGVLSSDLAGSHPQVVLLSGLT